MCGLARWEMVGTLYCVAHRRPTDRTSPGDYWTGDLSSMRGRVLFWGGLTRITALDEQPTLTARAWLARYRPQAGGRIKMAGSALQHGGMSISLWSGVVSPVGTIAQPNNAETQMALLRTHS